jgi:hypothetical protein
MRLFDAVSSGAKGAYFKSIIGTGTDMCTGHTFPVGEPTLGAVKLAENLQYITTDKPLIEVAVLFPNTSIALETAVLTAVYSQSSQLRYMLDLDLVDENMIADGALERYRFLVVTAGEWLRPLSAAKIIEWIRVGGIFIRKGALRLAPGGDTTAVVEELCSQEGGLRAIGNGYVLEWRPGKEEFLKCVAEAVHNRDHEYPWIGIPEIDAVHDGVYATRFADRVMYYNSNPSRVRKHVSMSNWLLRKTFEITLEPYSIVSVSLD